MNRDHVQAIEEILAEFAAENSGSKIAIGGGEFREDLFYRLNVIPVHLPPLRQRRGDIVPLAQAFLARAERRGVTLTLGPEAEEALLEHDWPGNVRELENAIERGVVLARGNVLTPEELLLDELEPEMESASKVGTLQECLDRAAEERIANALQRSAGRRAEAARELGVDRTTLFRWMRRLGIEA